MTNMPGLAGNEPLPQQTGNEPELNLGSTALAQLLATIDDMCRVQKQHRVRLMLVERSLRNLRQRVGTENRVTWDSPYS
ncbi:hypothetical protein [Bosea lathyri]|jgi:hypothetical protein|uniref:Uncharacterized protein n=1 Tax=Bosea lathyri TaxID=1036778 RepID=A0A1H5YYW3_9HYPH|nr:hypothetical protein [Bosea lathyri]SEG29423.1 hypothetical protein SAMN04488115_104174 [Bosea lathyri]